MSVNAIACAPKRIELPERASGGWEIPLGTSTRAPSAEAAVPTQPTQWWRSSLGRAAAGPLAFGDEVIAEATVDRYLSLLFRTSLATTPTSAVQARMKSVLRCA